MTKSGALAFGLAAGLWASTPVLADAPRWTVRGTVVLAPTCSGPNLEGPGCTAAFADASLVVHDAGGTLVVAKLKTGADGRFGLSLPAGRYRLAVQTTKVTRCAELAIELPAMQGRDLTIDCDTGRR